MIAQPRPSVLEALACLSESEQAVLLYLRASTFTRDCVTLRARELAAATGFSHSAVKTSLRSLAASELIECIERPRSRFTPGTWRILIPTGSAKGAEAGPGVNGVNGHIDRAPKPIAPRPEPPTFPRTPPATVNELCDRFARWAEAYYRHPSGEPTRNHKNLIAAVRPLRILFGDRKPETLVAEDFHEVQTWLLSQRRHGRPLARRSVNDSLRRIRFMVKWATRVPHRWLPATVLTEASLVESLRAGRTSAREPEPIRPVAWQQLAATMPYLSRQVRTMALLQWHTGMRPGEVCLMRACDLDMSGAVWWYRPWRHKTLHHGRARIVPIGPEAQKLVKPFLIGRAPEAYLFNPGETMYEWRAKRSAERRTPIQWGNSPGTNRKPTTARRFNERYTTTAYGIAIRRACARAFPPPADLRPRELPCGKRESGPRFRARLTLGQRSRLLEWASRHYWSPNQLRHAAATRIREQAGIEAAQALLGHANLKTTEIYAESSMNRLASVMQSYG